MSILQQAWQAVVNLNWETASYVVTVLGLPAALAAYLNERRLSRITEREEIDADLMQEYQNIIEKFIDHPELDQHNEPLSDPQTIQQQYRLYEIMISFFEKAFIQLYGRNNSAYKRMWHSWEDYIDGWLKAPNFKKALTKLLEGEDEDFAAYIQSRVKALDVQSRQASPDAAPADP